VFLQLKATDALQRLADGRTIAFPVERAHLEFWLAEPMPVVLIVYDAPADVAYWLYVQAHFEGQQGFDLFAAGETVTVHLSTEHVVDETAMREFARFRDDVLRQMTEVIRHHA
jgi:hypothetical protein